MAILYESGGEGPLGRSMKKGLGLIGTLVIMLRLNACVATGSPGSTTMSPGECEYIVR